LHILYVKSKKMTIQIMIGVCDNGLICLSPRAHA
jgi:hypothetical protein